MRMLTIKQLLTSFMQNWSRLDSPAPTKKSEDTTRNCISCMLQQNMNERYKIIPEVFLFLVVDGKILLSRRFQTGWEDGNYGLPAGHGEDGETMREGVRREAREEIGI